MGVGSALKQLRKAKGLTQQALADSIGMPKISLVNYERNWREPNSEAMVKLEKFFGVSGAYLRGEEVDSSMDNVKFFIDEVKPVKPQMTDLEKIIKLCEALKDNKKFNRNVLISAMAYLTVELKSAQQYAKELQDLADEVIDYEEFQNLKG